MTERLLFLFPLFITAFAAPRSRLGWSNCSPRPWAVNVPLAPFVPLHGALIVGAHLKDFV